MAEQDPINFEDQQEEWEQMHPQKQAHIQAAFVHRAGLGPHPGKYEGPELREPTGDPTVTELASQHMRELPAADPEEPKPPVPPQEEIAGSGPEPQKKAGKGKAPSAGTPAAIGAKAVAPPEPEGNF